MTNPFLFPEKFNPRIANDVAEAFRRNQERGLASSAAAGDISVRSLADVIKGNTADAKSNGGAGLTGLDQISNPETRHAFEASFEATERLFGYINVVPPTAEQCFEANIDIVALGAAYERLLAAGFEPAIVLSPNLDLANWRELYENLSRDPIANSNHMLKRKGLFIGGIGIDNKWDDLVIPPDGVPTVPSSDGTLIWSLRLIPSTLKPTTMGVQHSYNQAFHPTMSEYLSLQAARIQARQEPIDNHRNTWLHGSFIDSVGISRAPFGFWDYMNGVVCIGRLSASNSTNNTGARLPAWR